MQKILFFIFFLVSSCITITRMPNKSENDILTNNDSLYIREFSPNDAYKTKITSTYNDVYFQKISSTELKNIAKDNILTWVLVWATWCPHSENGLTRKYIPLMNTFSADGLGLIIISQDINFPFMQKTIFQSGYPYQTYFINPDIYGSNQDKRVNKFLKELSPELESIALGSPKHILLDKKGNVVSYFKGENMSSDTLSKYLKLNNY